MHLQYDLNINIENCPTNLKFYSDSQKTQEIETIRNGTGNDGDPKIASIHITRYVDKDSHREFDESIYWEWKYESTPGEEISDADLIDTEDLGKTVTAFIDVTGFEILEIPDGNIPGESFINKESVTFTGNNYINTGIYLFSEENIHRNFLISFDIEDVDESNVNHNALMNSMDESGTPWPGCVVKYSVSGSTKTVKFESNSVSNSSGDKNIPSNVKNIRIMRINDLLYYSLDGGQAIKINNYTTDSEKTFNVPVTFGASMDGNGNPFRYFKGTLSNMSVKFLSDDVSIDDINTSTKTLRTVYEHPEQYVFNGENYINTGLNLFTSENIDKDFEVSFAIDSIEPLSENQIVLVNGKDEGNAPSYPGFVYRIYTDGSIRFDAKGGSGNGNSTKKENVQTVKISRVNKTMYLSINNGEEKQVYDFTNFTNYHNVPLTIGAALKNGTPIRLFKGTLSNIVVKVEE